MDWILELRHEALTPLFLAFTFLGDATFFMIFLPLGYWLGRRDVFYRLGVLLFVSGFLNSILKAMFQVPRPDEVHLVEAHGWSFPSGHAQIAATLWPWLAIELRRIRPRAVPLGGSRGEMTVWLWPTAVALVAGVSASRVYLGVHYPIDVVAGVLVGLTLVALCRWFVNPAKPSPLRLGPAAETGGVVTFVGLGLAALTALGEVDSTSVLVSGALLGFWFGAALQRRFFDFAPPPSWLRRFGVIAVGLAGAFGLRVGLKLAFAALDLDWRLADFVRYGVIAAWLSCFGPWVFRRLRWMDGQAPGVR